MRRQLPPLNALRAFEATARHSSMSIAAEELSVRPNAISWHIHKLEEFLGARLFDRRPQHLTLTREGMRYATQLKALFDEIEFATQTNFEHTSSNAKLQINVTPTLATRWLVPRLSEFYRRHPRSEVQVNILYRIDPPDFATSNVDISVSRGDGSWPNLTCCKLFDEVLTPVCSPRLNRKIEQVKDLADCVLLHAEERQNDWAAWLAAANAKTVDPHSGLRLGNSHLAYQGAVHCLGVAMAQMAYVYDDVALKQLRFLFEHRLRTSSWYAVCHNSRALVPKIKTFFQWLGEEAEQYCSLHPELQSD